MILSAEQLAVIGIGGMALLSAYSSYALFIASEPNKTVIGCIKAMTTLEVVLAGAFVVFRFI